MLVLITLVAKPAALAARSWRHQIGRQIGGSELLEALRSAVYGGSRDIRYGMLRGGAVTTISIPIAAGRRYAFVGLCDRLGARGPQRPNGGSCQVADRRGLELLNGMPERCPVHDEPLSEGWGQLLDFRAVSSTHAYDLGDAVGAIQFPFAMAIILGHSSETIQVRYCGTCRVAREAWRDAPGSWATKYELMKLGLDPFRGTGVHAAEAELVADYVWIERWIRIVERLGRLERPASVRALESIDELILREARRARTEHAPMDATHRMHGEWMRIGDIEDEVIRMALGLGSQQHITPLHRLWRCLRAGQLQPDTRRR